MGKVTRNDKGEVVPEKCYKCGAKVGLYISGEPVYLCSKCGEYYGCMPFTLKEENNMPAKSKAQQRLFGMVHAYQKGELENPSEEIKNIADHISYKDAKKFAKTKHKKLPEKVDEAITHYNPKAVYIVYDGTSHYGVYGCDIEDEIRDNEVEVVKGPFAKWDDHVDDLIEIMNEDMYESRNPKQTITITESRLKEIISESVKSMLSELKAKKSVINAFYRMIHPYTVKRFRDNAWENVHAIFDVIGDWADDINVWVENGGYGESRDGMSKYKDWQFKFIKDGFEVQGYLRANACGDVDDVWSAYDVTIIVW